MNVSELMKRVWQAIPGTDMSDFLAEVNASVERVLLSWSWSFNIATSEITLIANYSTGTVAVTNGSTNVILTDGTFTAAMVGRKFRVTGDAAYYTVTTFNGAADIDLDRTYEGETDTEATFLIYQDTYSLPSDFRTMIDNGLVNRRLDLSLEAITDYTFTELGGASPGISVADVVNTFTMRGYDSSGNREIVVGNAPGFADVLLLTYRKRITNVDSPGDTPDLPAHMHELLFNDLARLYSIRRTSNEKDVSLIGEFKTTYQRLLERFKGEDGVALSMPVMGKPTLFGPFKNVRRRRGRFWY